ncbi:hypothetical protein T03_2457 [Trichinella britovi]|uniref:Uncharacterized protein n=1 Tax=Trichinella britovi TaxID=45882 RepID=A0A0V1C485_TRIBR|nr:hypothetical protein T03_2457 [Trichinella britovi]
MHAISSDGLENCNPLIHHNDIPDAEINSRPNLKKLVNGESRLTPPLTVTRQISTADAAGLKVTIYSKNEKSKYGQSHHKYVNGCLKTTRLSLQFAEDLPKSTCEEIKDKHQSLDNKR